jgi:hypothetical protein
MSKTFEIRREEKCLDYAGGQTELRKPGKILSFSCHAMQGNQMWTYEVNFELQKKNEIKYLFFRMICYNMHQVSVLNYHQKMIKMYLCLHVNQRINTKNGFGKNV